MTAVLGLRHVLAVGGGLAIAVLLLGTTAEILLIGTTATSARDRAVSELTTRVGDIEATLMEVAQSLAGLTTLRAGLTGDRPAIRHLFDVVRTAAAQPRRADLAITVYDARAAPRAWHGRPSELPPDRIQSGPLAFADAGPAGLRLVRVEPVVDSSSGTPTRQLGSVVTEWLLSSTSAEPGAGFVVQTVAGRAVLRAEPAAGPEDFHFEVAGVDGRPLMAASITLDEIARTRERWRRGTIALLLGVLALTALAAGGVAFAQRAVRNHLRTLAHVAAAVFLGRSALWFATPPDQWEWRVLAGGVYHSEAVPWLLRTPLDLMLSVALVSVLMLLAANGVAHREWAGRGSRRMPPAVGRVGVAGWQLGALVLVTMLLALHHLLLRDTVAGAALDLLHTSLQPFDPARVSVQLALVLASATVVGTIALVVGTSLRRWPVAQRASRHWLVLLLALLPPGLVVATGWAPPGPSAVMTGLGVLLAFRWRRVLTWFRHTDPLARVIAPLGALLVTALPLYWALVELTDDARRRQLETSYAIQAAEHPQDLQRQLNLSLDQIDTVLDRDTFATAPADTEATHLDTDRAFSLWRRTALARSRLTSAVEIYDADGALSSRFALNIPEYSVRRSRWSGRGCEWEVFGEVAPFGSEERRMLHAERGFCRLGPDGTTTPIGAVVVHVAQVDYESLPFIASRSPYVELFEASLDAPSPSAPGHEVELVIYGWGLRPAFLSSRGAWVIDDALFQRIYASRTPFWTRLVKDSRVYDVHITNTRLGIYALGYPIHTAFDHLLHLSEIAILVIVTFALGLGATVLAGLAVPTLRGYLVYREVRARFALKLQLWFLGVATAPAVVVAILIQGYFADQLRDDAEAGAARMAAIAQRVIEEAAVLQPPDGQVITPFTDDVLVWISQVVGQDVNIFDGPRLVATSERDLYASGLLPTRTPDLVYRAIALDQLPSFVSEDAGGSLRYQLAAAPVRVGGRDVILTVPLASRQQEIESQIDELNRRVWGSALFFAAVVGFIGWAIARSIADPVKRLTRATSRIARGEFTTPVSARHADLLEKRIAARSADELAVLESDFNRMASELDAQRRELERTHRLEAWTEMARQVAHEIKNPLTPMQLSAEHLLRVHADRGSPLSPVLQGCVDSILKQVRILRQIASEFSSYASSPVADRVPTALDALIEEIIGPYRPGLAGRVDLVVDVPADLPSLRLDRMLMRRALTNIVENALHAMPGPGSLSLRVVRQAATLQLVIADTGVGIEPEVLARIFEPYFSTRVTGTGLGMAIAKRNVELNGGTIDVTSQRGGGTTVTMTLPFAASPEAVPATAPSPRMHPPTPDPPI